MKTLTQSQQRVIMWSKVKNLSQKRGFSARKIAWLLGLDPRTVRDYLSMSEADLFAQKKLIPDSCLNDMIGQSPLDDDKIRRLGDKYRINPAIIFGRVCFEMGKYAFNSSIDKKLY